MTVPTPIGAAADWRDLDGDWYFSVARKADGSLWSWGWNQLGQLGTGTTNDSHVPVRIGSDQDWATFAVSRWHSLALKTNRTLWGWGMNHRGELG